MESNQTAAREARRFLAERVRDDWDWPNTPNPWLNSDKEVHGVTEFRERYYGTTSGSEAETEPETNAGIDPYKFDSPDSIAVAVGSKLEDRKRKRRAMLEEEITWNEGVACFVQRRDSWTGATAVKRYRNKTISAISPTGTTVPNGIANGAESSHDDTNTTVSMSQFTQGPESLAPIARPLLPHNPIRDSISPKTYSEIYNKVVVSSRSPSVPINLTDMTRALVQGWKENGEWPPRAGPLDPLAGRRKGAMTTSKKERDDMAKAHGEEAFLAHHPHMKRGMESVKRIFRLSGGHTGSSSIAHGPATNGG
ncbi:hypothetical protein AOQ84DRAFT_356359 [Glonium stellatum]|uniref:Gag1-like clamp domain-containing protein n=1 Tax=Glonium stellatum TaxID=574774 RepID=A0A8E2JPA4_9PEZI|nr:hypothetical protein AOQ84DRAFT_356359 [Glonium stellatum]